MIIQQLSFANIEPLNRGGLESFMMIIDTRKPQVKLSYTFWCQLRMVWLIPSTLRRELIFSLFSLIRYHAARASHTASVQKIQATLSRRNI